MPVSKIVVQIRNFGSDRLLQLTGKLQTSITSLLLAIVKDLESSDRGCPGPEIRTSIKLLTFLPNLGIGLLHDCVEASFAGHQDTHDQLNRVLTSRQDREKLRFIIGFDIWFHVLANAMNRALVNMDPGIATDFEVRQGRGDVEISRWNVIYFPVRVSELGGTP
jgi:hypothetical protein